MNNTTFESLMGEMEINLNMFSVFMEDGISINVNCGSIICMKCTTTKRKTSSASSPRSQCILAQAWDIALHSNSIKDFETRTCFLLFQEIRVGPKRIHHPIVERLVLLHPA